MPILANNARVEVENVVGTPAAIEDITNADPAVVTITAHGFTDGDIVKLDISDGMVELDGQVARVASSTVNDFQLEGIDTTNYSTYAAGTNNATSVTSWYTVAPATSLDIPNADPNEIDGTRLIDKKAVVLYGLAGSISGSIDIQHEPHSQAIQKIKGSTTQDRLAFRVTWTNGNIALFGANTAYSGGFSGSVGDIVSGNIPVTVLGDIAEYVS